MVVQLPPNFNPNQGRFSCQQIKTEISGDLAANTSKQESEAV